MNAISTLKQTFVDVTNDYCVRNGIKPVYAPLRAVGHRHAVIAFDNEIFGEGFYTVEYEYQPAEASIIHPVDDAYEGCSASADVCSVVLKGVEILPLLCKSEIERIEEQVLEQIGGAS